MAKIFVKCTEVVQPKNFEDSLITSNFFGETGKGTGKKTTVTHTVALERARRFPQLIQDQPRNCLQMKITNASEILSMK